MMKKILIILFFLSLIFSIFSSLNKLKVPYFNGFYKDVALDVIDDKYAGDAVKLKVYIASNGSYKTITAELIEDTSASSYSTQQQQQQTTTYSFFEYQP